jgi:predicted nucleotidyltransferase
MKAPTAVPGRSLEGIRTLLRRELPRLRHEYAVRSLEIFGSFVRGEASADSDVDVLVEFDNAPTLFGFVRLEDELSRLLGIKVDLVMKTGLKPALGARILAEAIAV